MKREITFATLLLVAWVLCAGFAWRLAFRDLTMSQSEPALRMLIGNLGLATTLLVSCIPLNRVYRRLGGAGHFLRWSLDVLNRAAGRK